ncbi:MAG: alpha-glucosidase [Anaerolineales bacterium]|nr:alpha-glucosidase [Anaerolineales bacterium]
MTTPSWWKDAVCYQIYPRSFADANGDGIGDLRGIIDKLDYLQWLGVTVLWLSPFFPSPQFDVGYDISDYRDVDPDYGSLDDFDHLLAAAHQRGIRVLLDLVLNHTSDQHEWFQQSRLGPDNPYHDWYIWREGRDGGPPNDWESIFGGSAWQYDETVGQYYYHYFFKEQPDLNWRNPVVKQRMFDEVRFWLDRGVDGFRLDAIGAIYEDPDLPDAEVNVGLEEIFLNWTMGVLEGTTEAFRQKIRYQDDLPENHGLMKALRELIDTYEDRVLLGETDDPRYYGNGVDELHSVFNFDILRFHPDENFDASQIRQKLLERQPRLPDGVWECNTLSNHDRSRSFSFYGEHPARYRVALAMAVLLHGTPVIYNGEEIGMGDYPMQDISWFKDNLGVWIYRVLQQKRQIGQEEALMFANIMGRDKCRTPMQWANMPNGGFSPSGVQTWLPVNPNYAVGVNVAEQEQDPESVLHYVRRLIAVRQNHKALRRGVIRFVEHTTVLAFWREIADQRCLVALNMSDEAVTVQLDAQAGKFVFGTHAHSAEDNLAALVLQPYEVYVGIAR